MIETDLGRAFDPKSNDRNSEMTQAIVYWFTGLGVLVLAFFEVAQAF